MRSSSRWLLAALVLVGVVVVSLYQRSAGLPRLKSSATTLLQASPQPDALAASPAASPSQGSPVARRSSRRSVSPRTGSARSGSATPGVTASPASAAATPLPGAVGASPAPVAPLTLPAFDDLIASVPARVGLVIELPDGTVAAERLATDQFEAASLYKLGIMVELYRERDAGLLSFDDALTLRSGYFVEDDSVYGYGDVGASVPIDELLQNMIVVSSNVAAEALLDRVGTPQVNATMAGLGLTQTEIRWSPIAGSGTGTVATVAAAWQSQSVVPAGDPATATNVTSPGDMARLFQLLLAGKVVNPQASQEMLDLLSQQEINDRLPAALPAGTRVAHKTGNLDDVVHDAGVIYAPRGPVVVAILCDQVEDEEGVDVLMQRIAKTVYDAYS